MFKNSVGLRIGNNVFYTVSGSEKNIGEITQIAKTEDGVRVTIDHHYPLSFGEPIPLTEDWLIKFGFSDKDYKPDYIGIDFKSGGMTLDFVLSKPFTKGEWNKHYTFDFEGHRFIPFEFVHELQNFFYCVAGCELQPVSTK